MGTSRPEVTISVVIPAYNAAHFLPRSLASVFAQTLPPTEVIVVDDGSSDNSAQVAEQLGAKVIRRPNGGQASARNAGIEAARGEWIALLDADDWWEPKKLARQTAAIRPGAVLVYTGAKQFDDSGVRAVHRAIDPSVAKKMLRYSNPITASSVLVRRQAVLDLGGFNVAAPPCEDWELWARLLPIGQFVAVEDPLTQYWLSPQSSSASPERMLAATSRIMEETLLNGLKGIPRFAWRRRIWAAQLLSAALIARDNRLKGEFGYAVRSLLAWPSPFFRRQRFAVFAVSLRNVIAGCFKGASQSASLTKKSGVNGNAQDEDRS
ncbi:MAG: glycosyltransferase family A protein [Terracidiphilus sp.]